MRIIIVLIFSILTGAFAAPLSSLVQVEDGLSYDDPNNIKDDYIRLTLLTPDYQTAATIKQKVEAWIGPGIVSIESKERLKIQAPRDSSARVEFIAALLNIDI